LTLLLEARADITVKDKAGNTCLHYAAHCGSHDIMDFLVKTVPPDLLDLANNVSTHIVSGTGEGGGLMAFHFSNVTVWPLIFTSEKYSSSRVYQK